MKLDKNIPLCMLAAFTFGILFFGLFGLFLPYIGDVAYGVLFLAIPICASIGFAFLATRKNFMQIGSGVLIRVGYISSVATMSLIVMFMGYFLSVVIGFAFLD